MLSFVHVPKTGGISVATALGEPRGTHVQASGCKGFVFTFVRNPYTRLYSAFRFSQSERYDTPILPKHMTFREFVLERRYLNEPRGMFNQMLHWIDAPVGFVGRYEQLQQDFDRLCDILGARRMTLPWEHRLEARTDLAMYDEEMKTLVAKDYAADFERFRYES